MPFVKLDCGILNSTLWFERECREVFITALLMAEPYEITEPTPQIAVDSLENTGWEVPPGWYGFVPAAGIGIIHRARITDEEVGREALRRLGSPEASSRSPEFDGRRLVRIDGGYLVLNYIKYRERDYTTAQRSKRYRERLAKTKKSQRDATPSHRDITQAEGEEESRSQRTDAEKEKTPPPPLIRSPLEVHRQRQHCVFVGARLDVPNKLHGDLRRKLGGPTADADLMAWYQDLDAEIEASNESIAPNVFKWLEARYAKWKGAAQDDPVAIAKAAYARLTARKPS